jgi:DNA polymerase-3 subunit alpha
VVNYIGECREIGRYAPGHANGIEVLAPNVNESEWKFTPVSDTQIRFGLGAVRGLGEGAVRSILDARRAGGPFKSLFELVERTDFRALGKRALEALVQAGACDSFGHRAQLMAGLELAMREAQLRQAEEESGQVSLFDAPSGPSVVERQQPLLPDVPHWTEADRLAREKEILGFFISGHPLEKYREDVQVFDVVNTANLKQHRDQRIELACVVTGITRQISKKNGSEWARVTVEDFYGTATVLAFAEVWDTYRNALSQDTPVLIRGVVSGRDEDDPPVFLDSVVTLASVRANGSLGLEVKLSPQIDAVALESATTILRSSPGTSPVIVRWARVKNGAPNGGNGARSDGEARMRSRSLTVTPTDAVIVQLRELLGAEGVRLVKT